MICESGYSGKLSGIEVFYNAVVILGLPYKSSSNESENFQVISHKEYYPYGSTAFQAMNANVNATAKRYRFAGKERDEESGLYYHGARYYAPWLGRWTVVDPLEAEYAPWSSYNYCFDNPVNYTDSTGMGPDDPQKMPEVTLDEVEVKAFRHPPPIATPPSTVSVSAADNTSVWRMNPTQIEQGIEASRQNVLRSVVEEAYWNQQFIGSDDHGHFYSYTRRGLAQQEARLNEAWREAIVNGPFGAAGSLIGGRESALHWSVVDQVMMSVSHPGTPYGRQEPVITQHQENVPVMEQRPPKPNFTFDDFNSFNAAKSSDVINWLEHNNWNGIKTNQNRTYNDGMRFTSGIPGEQVRIMPGGKTRSIKEKTGPYMEISMKNKKTVIVLYGNPTLSPPIYKFPKIFIYP